MPETNVDVTIAELVEKLLSQYDIVDIIELLDISSTELVYNFIDKIEDRYEQVLQALGEVDD